jgi:uncharacterized protein DUF4160
MWTSDSPATTGRHCGAGGRAVKVGPSARASRAPGGAPLTARPPARRSAQVVAGEGLARAEPVFPESTVGLRSCAILRPGRGRPIRTAWHRRWRMSPTVFRDGPFRFFFFSREEERLHIHVQSPDGEAKFWIEPQIELARNYDLTEQDLSRALQLIVDREQEIRDAWHKHFDT